MIADYLEAWKPLDDLPQRLTVDRLTDDEGSVEIRLSSESDGAPVIALLFRDLVAYRCVDESYRLRTWSTSDSPISSSLFIIKNSSWIRWLVEESLGVLEEFDLTHYGVFTNDHCIDIATKAIPEVKPIYHATGRLVHFDPK